MAERITMWPDVVNLSGTTQPTIRCNLNFSDLGDQLKDARVKLTVYSESVYFGSDLGAREWDSAGRTLFTKDDAILSDKTFFLDPSEQTFIPGTILRPITGKGTGVLLTMEGFLRRSEGRFGRPWFFTPIKKDEFAGSVEATIVLAMPNAQGEHVAIANISFPEGDLQMSLTYEAAGRVIPYRIGTGLTFRMALLEPVGALKAGFVIASTANPKHSSSSDRHFGGIMITGVPDEKSQSLIGADGGKRDVNPQSATSRGLDRDLTGFYEAFLIGGVNDVSQDPPMLLHLHQAGHSLVGWFSFPRGNIGNTAQKPNPSGLPLRPGCLNSPKPPDEKGVRDFEWFEGKRPNPDLRPWRNVSDPDDQFNPEGIDKGVQAGQLKIVGNHGPRDVLQEIEVTFFVPARASGIAPPKPVPLVLRRVSVKPRLPFYILKDFEPLDLNDPPKNDLGAAMIAEQVEPIPISFWNRVILRLQKDLTPIMEQFIDAGNDEVLRITPRDRADALLLDIIKDLGAGDRVVAAENIRSILAGTRLELSDGGTVRPLDGLEFMVGSKMDFLRKNSANANVKDDDLYRNFIGKGFQALGIRGFGRFIYTLTFKTKDAPIKNRYVVQFGLSGFVATIKKEIEVDVSGKTERKPDTTAGWAKSEEKLFFGVYGEGGVAAGWDIANMKLKSGKPGSKPGSVEIQTFVDIPSVTDFNGANFSITALKLGSLSSPVGGAKLIDSAFFQISLSNGVFLDAVVETNLKISAKIDEKSIFEAFRKESLDPKDFLPSVSIISLTKGWGKFILNPDKVEAPPPRAVTFAEQKRHVRRTTPITFDVDSAELIGFQRVWFEWALAMDRALYTEGEGTLVARGFASPEASKDHNLKLSEARAFTIMQGIQDAFGSQLSVSDLNRKAEGLGEDPSEEPLPKGDGLLDPEAGPPAGMSAEAFKVRIHEEQRKFWPRWRRVDVIVNGVVSVRVMGRGARSD